jgi:hypothetical protein
VVIGKSQTSFIDVIVKPTFDALAVVSQEVLQNVKNLEANRKRWDEYEKSESRPESPRRLL